MQHLLHPVGAGRRRTAPHGSPHPGGLEHGQPRVLLGVTFPVCVLNSTTMNSRGTVACHEARLA